MTALVALALSASLSADVPFLPQTPDLCGGAAAAMVFRYWGDAHADVEQFAPLVDRGAGGIEDRRTGGGRARARLASGGLHRKHRRARRSPGESPSHHRAASRSRPPLPLRRRHGRGRGERHGPRSVVGSVARDPDGRVRAAVESGEVLVVADRSGLGDSRRDAPRHRSQRRNSGSGFSRTSAKPITRLSGHESWLDAF